MACKTEVDALLLAEANNKLAVMLHKNLAEDEKNVFFSPISISMAMAMLFRGTKADTADELRDFLGFTGINLSDEQVHKTFGDLLKVLCEAKNIYTLTVSNALVSHKEFEIIPEFKSDLQNIYQALALEVDFVNDSLSAVNTINKWVKENTRNMIQKLVDSFDPATVMVILNAVYFKGTWMKQFDPSDTYTGTFFNKGNENQPKDVQFMTMSKRFLFAEEEEYKALSLPYVGDDMSMIFLLPNQRNGLRDLERKINDNFLPELLEKMFEEKVDVTIPKLHIEYFTELRNVFQRLGLKKIFQTSGNFGGISEDVSKDLVVSDVIHKAVLDVNEEGSEAAAVTGIIMMALCLPIYIEFRADHPFLFIIYHKKLNMILFMGRIEEL